MYFFDLFPLFIAFTSGLHQSYLIHSYLEHCAWNLKHLVSGFPPPFWKINSSRWIIFCPFFGVKQVNDSVYNN